MNPQPTYRVLYHDGRDATYSESYYHPGRTLSEDDLLVVPFPEKVWDALGTLVVQDSQGKLYRPMFTLKLFETDLEEEGLARYQCLHCGHHLIDQAMGQGSILREHRNRWHSGIRFRGSIHNHYEVIP